MNYAEKAETLFRSGLNCSQSVFVAFADKMGLDELTARKISIGLGGGVGRLREVCGAVSGAAMVLGMFFGAEDGLDRAAAYEKVQEFAKRFRMKNGYIVCRELRGLDKNLKETFVPEARTAEYYKSRPCPKIIYDAAKITEDILTENNML